MVRCVWMVEKPLYLLLLRPLKFPEIETFLLFGEWNEATFSTVVDIACEDPIPDVVVREHDLLGRDVELFRKHLYSSAEVGPTSKGSVGAELVDGLVIKEGDYKLVKTRMSAFFATPLHSILRGAEIKNLVVVGVQTPNCIRQTVFDAVALDYPSITVIVDATAAATPETHMANILDMKNVGVATPTLQEWVQS